MGLRSPFSRSSNLEPGNTIEILGLMKEARKHITAAVLLTLATVGSALLYAGIVLKLHRKPGQEAELDNWVKQLTCGGTHGQHAQ